MIDRELLAIIGLIYDAAIDPGQWTAALEAIRVRHGWFNSNLSVLALPQQTAVISVALNIPDSMYQHPTMITDVVAMLGGAEHMAQLPLEEPVLTTDHTELARWVDYPFARDWALPLGIDDQVAIALARDRTTHGMLGFAKHKSMVLEPRMLDELRLFAPHLRRVATVSRLLENSMERAATFEAALDATPAGAVLVRGDMAIVHANAAAGEMLRGGDPIRSLNGRLQLAGELTPGHLDRAVQAAAAGVAAIGRRGIGIPARRDDGSPLVTHVMPLETRLGAKRGADAVVFLADTGGGEPVPSQSLELLFGLTPAEVRAFELVVAGRPDPAGAMGVAESTFRSHLRSAFAKTGRHSRAGLVQLASELGLQL